MQKLFNLCFTRLPKLAAVAVIAAPLAGSLHAQQTAVPVVVNGSSTSASEALPTLHLDARTAMAAPAAAESSSSSSSSSSSNELLALGAAPTSLAAGADGNLQPPPYRRRRYGAPRYSDKMHNADGSNKLAFVAGGGFNVPVGSATSDYQKLSWRFEGGVGYNLSRKLGVMAQFDWDNFGLPGSVLANQETLYTNITGDTSGSFTGLDGHTHVWSLTLNPTLNFYQSDTLGAYAVVGGGFYHKVTNFTVPAIGTYCDYYGYCYQYQANQTIDSYTSNAPGVTGGIGVTYKFSRFANEKFFAEARYVHTFNQARAGDASLTGAANGTPYNLYPPNSNETSYIPITVGIRF